MTPERGYPLVGLPRGLDLIDLVAEGQHALAAPPMERVSAALRVLPALVEALDRVAQYQHDVRQLRTQLVEAVRTFRQAVWESQRRHPEVTYNAAKVQRALAELTILLDRLAALLHTS